MVAVVFPVPSPTAPFPVGEAAEFLRWTAALAPEAAGYWAAPAVANYALAGEAVVDFPTAFTASPLFDVDGWNAAACVERGATEEQMPRVAAPGHRGRAGRQRGTGCRRHRRGVRADGLRRQ